MGDLDRISRFQKVEIKKKTLNFKNACGLFSSILVMPRS